MVLGIFDILEPMNRLLYVSFFIFLAACGGESEESNNETEEVAVEIDTLCFTGTLDDQYEFRMRLALPVEEDGKVTGAYFYQSQQKEIELKGSKEGDQIELDEYVDGEITGHFSGVIEIGSLWTIVGEWTSPDESKSIDFFIVEDIDNLYEDYLTFEEVGPTTSLDWPDFYGLFELKHLPIELQFKDELEEATELDSFSVKEYLLDEGEMFNEWGWNEHYPICKFEHDGYVALITQHYYSPGVGGVNDNIYELHTFDIMGEKIDQSFLGCAACSDSNYDDIWYSSAKIVISEDGIITVNTKSTHESLLESDDPEYFEAEVSEDSKTYEILYSGEIVGDE